MYKPYVKGTLVNISHDVQSEISGNYYLNHCLCMKSTSLIISTGYFCFLGRVNWSVNWTVSFLRLDGAGLSVLLVAQRWPRQANLPRPRREVTPGALQDVNIQVLNLPNLVSPRPAPTPAPPPAQPPHTHPLTIVRPQEEQR